jgi:hypothetical protein
MELDRSEDIQSGDAGVTKKQMAKMQSLNAQKALTIKKLKENM